MDLQENEEKGQANSKAALENSLIRSKGDLLADLSIELRTPLNTILGFASLLQDPLLSDPDRKRFVQRIIANGDHLLQVLDDALNYAKVQKGELSVEFTEFNLAEMVNDVAQPLKTAADRKGINLLINFKTPIPETIHSDPLKVRQILTNLLGNAVRYAVGEGFILVSLSYLGKNENSGEIRVEIDDSGLDISSDKQLSRSQAVDELEGSFHTELLSRPGLVLSQEFAKTLGGAVTVLPSALGEGRSYELVLPTGNIHEVQFLKRIKSPSIVEKVVGSFKKSHRLEGVRVLLVEDSEDNETLIRLYLNKEGAKLSFAHNGLEAIDAVKKQEYDLILMDIQMPLLDGLEATRQIRRMGFKKPILALTGEAMRDDAEKSLKAGCDTHISKPVRKEVLVEEIQKRAFH
jgi:CheY-like chemotaxis protein